MLMASNSAIWTNSHMGVGVIRAVKYEFFELWIMIKVSRTEAKIKFLGLGLSQNRCKGYF
jgi:hypothetical protein